MVSTIDSNRVEAEKTNVIPLPLPKGQGGETPRLCIPCAVGNFGFRERAPLSQGSPLDVEDTPRAWINGRGYRLFRHPAFRATCIECGETVCAAYVPDDPQPA
ncbi:MAG: hypothetical protein ABSC19_02755 [Syntrophorhabdales bacterium]|jgi:hypothetical protein